MCSTITLANEGMGYFMLGTIVNAIAILICGGLGLLLKGGIKERYRVIITQAQGIAVVFVGLSGAITNMQQEGAHPILFVISLAIGACLGEWIDIEYRLEQLGNFIQDKMKGSSSNIALGFVTTSLLYCVGTMAILGSIESGINGNHSILYAKSILDGVLSIVLASSLGIGVLFSAGSVLIYQGSITMCAIWLQPFITDNMLREVGIVGGILITIIGLNLLEITKIKVGNMLPAVIIPVVYYAIMSLI